ncbi:MAG: hypothetical protein IPM13_16540 [Phycisphaerales bacterium]|nr:hypothetical protein [Phycisphaerales bacterium]
MRLQHELFEWMASQPGVTGLAVFALGLLCALTGFRMRHFFVTVGAGALGALLGVGAAAILAVPPMGMAALGSVVAGGLAVVRPTSMTVITGTAAWAGLGCYLANQLRFPEGVALSTTVVAGVLALVLTLVSRPTMTLLCTCIVGSGLMVLGFVGLASATIPSLGATFCTLADRQAIVVPVLVGMLTITTFSYQANARRGDLITGGSGELAS